MTQCRSFEFSSRRNPHAHHASPEAGHCCPKRFNQRFFGGHVLSQRSPLLHRTAIASQRDCPLLLGRCTQVHIGAKLGFHGVQCLAKTWLPNFPTATAADGPVCQPQLGQTNFPPHASIPWGRIRGFRRPGSLDPRSIAGLPGDARRPQSSSARSIGLWLSLPQPQERMPLRHAVGFKPGEGYALGPWPSAGLKQGP